MEGTLFFTGGDMVKNLVKEKLLIFLVAFSWLVGSMMVFGFIILTLINTASDRLLMISFGVMVLWGMGSIVAWTLSKKWITIINNENFKKPID